MGELSEEKKKAEESAAREKYQTDERDLGVARDLRVTSRDLGVARDLGMKHGELKVAVFWIWITAVFGIMHLIFIHYLSPRISMKTATAHELFSEGVSPAVLAASILMELTVRF